MDMIFCSLNKVPGLLKTKSGLSTHILKIFMLGNGYAVLNSK